MRSDSIGDAEPMRGDADSDAEANQRDASADQGDAPADLPERIRGQLPKACSDRDVEAVVAIVEYLRDEPEGWASPSEIRDALHGEHPAGKENREYWWSKMAEWLDHVDEVERVHQRRFEWVGSGASERLGG